MSTTLEWNSVVGQTLSGSDVILRHPLPLPALSRPVVRYELAEPAFVWPSHAESATQWMSSVLNAAQSAPWFAEAAHQVNRLLRLPPNWDQQGAPPIDPAIAEGALLLLFAAMGSRTPVPLLVPTFSGGIQLEWHRGGLDVEIEIHPDRKVDLFVSETESNREIEGDFWENLPEFVAALTKLSS